MPFALAKVGILGASGNPLPISVPRDVPSASPHAQPEQRNIFGAEYTSSPETCDECGVSVFFIGREARARDLETTISQIVESAGFELLSRAELNESNTVNYSIDASPPVAALVGFDVAPSSVPSKMRPQFPELDNVHIHEAMLRCREFFETQPFSSEIPELVRCTQNSQEALQVIQQILPDDEQALLNIMESRKSAMATHFEVVRHLTRRGTRSKVELIRYREGLAVKKTYRHNCLRFMEREASFMDRFSPDRAEIPPVLERGPNYLIMPFIDGRPLRRLLFGRSFPRLMTLKQARDTADLLRYLFANGYDPVDFGPHNLLVDATGQVSAIDYEFMYRSDEPIDPECSACLSGIREGFPGEWPPKARWTPQRAKSIDPWPRGWFACTGLTVHSFLYDPPWVQRLKRAVNYPLYLAAKAVGWQYPRLRSNESRHRGRKTSNSAHAASERPA